MSAWFESVGWLWIAIGAYMTWRESSILVSGRRGGLRRAERTARRKALTSLPISFFYIAIGVVWVARWYTHLVAWVLGGYLLVLVAYDLSAWIRSRSRRASLAGSQSSAD